MTRFRNIQILEKQANAKGDLFGRLMSDLLHSLGYNEPRLNIHKSGREIDIQAFHRVEHKIAIAECKAQQEKVGGDDINKFAGALDAEKRKYKKEKSLKSFSILGYFISLSGFKETAIEQEQNLDNARVILLDSPKIIKELIEGKIIVSIEDAISALPTFEHHLRIMKYADLIAYEKGWVWLLYFSNNQGQKATHFGLVHADGKPLIGDLAIELLNIDLANNLLFKDLELLNLSCGSNNDKLSYEDTSNKYFKYIENECGEIQFDGLPTDKEAGAVRVKLESIFVPPYLSKIAENTDEVDERVSIGSILHTNRKLALLAKPGGGKSTLIKRIAIAYAFPERRKFIDDDLPDKDWFPIFIRCRELGEKVVHSITEIINSIPSRAELNDHKIEFSKIISKVLQSGKGLLLIDGLDEISEDRNRISFVNQLRTFIATYPNINIIVTSREAGFRAVGGMLAIYCDKYKVANLNDDEIDALTLKWHKAIIDESENTIREAKKIASLIIKDNRIKVLAENPLLLTTLLFVKRWAGYLPTKRTVLYQEMIKLLLVTWNVEGHDQLDIEEAEPQLAFIAYWMTTNGIQTITEEQLKTCLIDCRRQLPEILGYTTISPTDFIKRVESRSSLLILTGHKRSESGQLQQIYEFLHLSFQEYLTAKAIVKKYLPHDESTLNFVDIIRPNIDNQYWKEVIPITAVLLERDAKKLIEVLINESKQIAHKDDFAIDSRSAPILLGNCIANEIQIGPELLDNAIEWYVKNHYKVDSGLNEIILNSKFGLPFRQKIINMFFLRFDDQFAASVGSTISEMFIYDHKDSELINGIESHFMSNDFTANCIGILGVMQVGFAIATNRMTSLNSFPTDFIINQLIKFVASDNEYYVFTSCWAIAWLGENDMIPEEKCSELFQLLLPRWIADKSNSINRMATWVLKFIIRPTFNHPILDSYIGIKELINERFDAPKNDFDKSVTLFLGILVGVNWNKRSIVKRFKEVKKMRRFTKSSNKSFELFAEMAKIDLNETVQSKMTFGDLSVQ